MLIVFSEPTFLILIKEHFVYMICNLIINNTTDCKENCPIFKPQILLSTVCMVWWQDYSSVIKTGRAGVHKKLS